MAETDGKKTTNKYTRKGEKDLEPFEEHLKIRISEKTESSGSFKWTYALLQSLAYTERLKKPLIQVKLYKKCALVPEILKSSMSAKSYVRIFRTSPVWREHKSPDFLDKPCLAKTQKSVYIWFIYGIFYRVY